MKSDLPLYFCLCTISALLMCGCSKPEITSASSAAQNSLNSPANYQMLAEVSSATDSTQPNSSISPYVVHPSSIIFAIVQGTSDPATHLSLNLQSGQITNLNTNTSLGVVDATDLTNLDQLISTSEIGKPSGFPIACDYMAGTYTGPSWPIIVRTDKGDFYLGDFCHYGPSFILNSGGSGNPLNPNANTQQGFFEILLLKIGEQALGISQTNSTNLYFFTPSDLPSLGI